MPITSRVSCWGHEIYFDIGFKTSAENSSMDVDAGYVVYRSKRGIFVCFLWPTSASDTEKPVPVSPVVVVDKTKA